jgi:hypothetical protein
MLRRGNGNARGLFEAELMLFGSSGVKPGGCKAGKLVGTASFDYVITICHCSMQQDQIGLDWMHDLL